ncbi:hypothetical protein HPB51_009140 [Rhipicephalus microplus]|uniref:RNA helicase n=1 Tax=Rhipicephalus microplus TaxID=6941 RepID=A0A9J6F0E0_RHIMP|nr:hypothetical protein HPB51_009140 [Rhipicephalus microplus]
MSSWAQDADEQENIDGSGDASPSNDGEKNSVTGNDEPALTEAEASLMRKILRSRIVSSTHEVEVDRRDPNSPLFSIKTFEELKLRPELLKGVYASGFDLPSKIQETALPTLLADPPQNMIAQSQSGTGKTAAFILASLSRVDESQRYPQVLILSPTYELAIQTGQVAKKMAQFCKGITFCYAVRGVTFSHGDKIEDQVILGTPGKIIDWAFKFKFFDLSRIKVFVLDEADIMIAQQGHHDQSIRIHKRLSSNCQMMLFSATYDKDVMEFAEMIISNPVIIRLRKEEESLDYIRQYYVICVNKEEKFSAISNIYGVLSVGQSIIFCHTRQAAVWLAGEMTKEGHTVSLLSGELTIEQRVDVLTRFRRGVERVLITTNVCARVNAMLSLYTDDSVIACVNSELVGCVGSASLVSSEVFVGIGEALEGYTGWNRNTGNVQIVKGNVVGGSSSHTLSTPARVAKTVSEGIDVEQVTVVINFDLPVDMKGRADCETYLHRIGRTGRFGKSGFAVNLVEGSRGLQVIKQIEEHFARTIKKLDFKDLDQLESMVRGQSLVK